MAHSYDEPRAHQLREAYRATFGGDELPVPVEAIAEDLLGLAIEVRADLPVSGMLLPAQRLIVLRSDEPEARRRFTIAHELGHWICQALEGDMQPVYCRAGEIGVDAATKALEREANIFAANLLMPEPSVRSAWQTTGTVAGVATRFDVSPEAMEWRLHNFGFVPAPGPAPPTAS
jgi:Zn-dependent peptidase ImmA (M78 family)